MRSGLDLIVFAPSSVRVLSMMNVATGAPGCVPPEYAEPRRPTQSHGHDWQPHRAAEESRAPKRRYPDARLPRRVRRQHGAPDLPRAEAGQEPVRVERRPVRALRQCPMLAVHGGQVALQVAGVDLAAEEAAERGSEMLGVPAGPVRVVTAGLDEGAVVRVPGFAEERGDRIPLRGVRHESSGERIAGYALA